MIYVLRDGESWNLTVLNAERQGDYDANPTLIN